MPLIPQTQHPVETVVVDFLVCRCFAVIWPYTVGIAVWLYVTEIYNYIRQHGVVYGRDAGVVCMYSLH